MGEVTLYAAKMLLNQPLVEEPFLEDPLPPPPPPFAHTLISARNTATYRVTSPIRKRLPP